MKVSIFEKIIIDKYKGNVTKLLELIGGNRFNFLTHDITF